MTERWPPSYDANDLKETISKLLSTDEIENQFYTAVSNKEYYQGDIIKFRSGAPLITADGTCGVYGEMNYWLVTGNTCDISRDISYVQWTQVIPILEVPLVDESKQKDFLKYKPTRVFYLPSWNSGVKDKTLMADFLMPVTIHKKAIFEHATVVARLDFHSWLLLNSCLVRFQARDDGRFES